MCLAHLAFVIGAHARRYRYPDKTGKLRMFSAMKLLRTILAVLVSVTLPLPSLAAPHTIAQLGVSPLLGQVTSTPELQQDVARNQHIFSTAATKLGLTPREYAEFANRIANGRVSYVTIPRHLDAMTWASNGRVYALNDVIIPANTHGWEVDLVEGHQVLAMFVPAKCANLSLLRRPLPALAQAPPRQRVRVAAAETGPPAPVPNAQGGGTPVASPAPAVAVAAPVATPPPYASAAASTGPSHRGIGWWPLLLVPIIALIGHGGGGGGNTNVPGVPVVGGPPPGTTTSSVPPPGGMLTVQPPPPSGCPSPKP